MRGFGFAVEGARSLKIFLDRETGYSLTFEKLAPNSLRLTGDFVGSAVVVELKKRNLEEFFCCRADSIGSTKSRSTADYDFWISEDREKRPGVPSQARKV